MSKERIIRNIFSDPLDIVTNPGEKVTKDYKMILNDDGVEELVECGEIDLDAIIQSHKDECLIENILKRYANGDESVLKVKAGVYEDVSEVPKDLKEFDRYVDSLKAELDKLKAKVNLDDKKVVDEDKKEKVEEKVNNE